MANQPDQNLDPVSAAWNNSKQLRDQLAAKAGTPDAPQDNNLELSLSDAPEQLVGSGVSGVGSGIKNIDLGSPVRAAESIQDGSALSDAIGWAGGKLADAVLSPEKALAAKIGMNSVLGLTQRANVNNSDKQTNNAVNAVADTADKVIKPVAETIGGGIQNVGDAIKDRVSDQGKEALKKQYFSEDNQGHIHAGDAWTTDPAVWAMKMSDVIGSSAGMFAVGGAVQGGIKQMVVRSMLKRGAPEAYAAQVAELTAQKLSNSAVMGTGMAMSVGQSADQTRDAVNGLSYEELMNSDTFKRNVQLVGDDPANQSLTSTQRLNIARQRTADEAAQQAKADPTTYAAGIAGTLGDSMLFKMIGSKEGAFTGNILNRSGKGLIKGAAGEAVGEGLENGAQQNIQNRTENKVAGTNIDPMQGVTQSAIEGGLLGALSGGVMGAGGGAINSSNADGSQSHSEESNIAPQTDNTQSQDATTSDVTVQQSDQVAPKPDDIANIPAYMRSGQELSPELEQARSQAINNAWRDQSAQKSAEQAGVLQPRDVQVTGNPDEPAFLRTQQNNPTGRDTSTLQDANPYTDTQGALANGGAPTAEELIQQSIQQGDQGKTPHESGLTGNLILSDKQGGLPATTEQTGGMTVDGQSSEIIPESRGLGYNNQINMSGEAGNGINDNYVPPVTQSRQTADQSLGVESTRNPRSPVAQSIESAGQQADAVFNALKTVRVTKRGQPFSSQKEAQLASRKTETPIELPTGGYGIVDKAELDQAQAKVAQDTTQNNQDDHQATNPEVDANESASNNVVAQNQPDINVNDQSASQATVKQSATDIPAPSPDSVGVVMPDGSETTVGELSRQNEQPKTEEQQNTPDSTARDQASAQKEDPATPKQDFPWTSYKEKPDGTMLLEGDSAKLSEWAKANNVLTIKSKSGVIVGKKSAPIVKDIIEKNSSETQTPESKAQDASPQAVVPWKNVTDKADGTMVMEGDPSQLSAWAKQNNITAIKSKAGIVVGKSSVPAVKDILSKAEVTQNKGISPENTPSHSKETIDQTPLSERQTSNQPATMPWTSSIDKPDGTMILEGDPVALKAWAKDNNITAIKSKVGVVVGKSSVPAVKDLISKHQDVANVTSNDGLSHVSGTSDVAASDNAGGSAAGSELAAGVHGRNSDTTLRDANNAEAAVVEPGRNGSDNTLTKPPEFAAKSTDTSNKSGISKEEVDRVVEEFKREYKGNIPPEIITRQTQEEAYGPEATIDRVGKIEGGYLPAGNKLHIIADNISTKRDRISGNPPLSSQRPLQHADAIRRVLRHEILGHYGLNTFSPEEKRSLIGKIKNTRNDAVLGKTWAYVDKNYADKSESKKAEEVFAHIAEEKHGVVSDAWNRVLSSLHGIMRRNGMLNKDVTIHELREYARSIAKGIKSGERKQQIFPSDNESQYRKADTETATKGGFSLSTMPKNEAEISGKGMTKPEAAMVAKEWLRKFKTDINVEVVKNQAEFESALADRGFANSIQSGEMDNAAYLPDSKTILINASAIQNPKRLKQIMRHEILVHHGLRYVIGEDAYTKIMNAIARGYETSPAIRDAVDTVTKNYADKDMFTQMEDAFAHYAENRPADSGPVGRMWQRIVGMVKSALQKVGFIGVNESEQHLDEVLHAIANNMRKGIENGVLAQKTDNVMFSRTLTADEERMSKLGLGPKPGMIEETMGRLSKLQQSDRNAIKSWFDQLIKQANTQVLDHLAPIKYAEDKAGKFDAAESAYVAARLSSGSATVMNATMLYGLPEWRDGVIQRKVGTTEKDALLGIFEDLGPNLHDWLAWMAGHRAEILAKEGRENLLTAEDIAAFKAKGYGKEAQFNAAKQKWNALNKAVLDLGEEAGLFTPEERATWQNEWYVPFYRETEDGDVTAPYKQRGFANQSSGIKKLKGGTANVNDLLENIFTSTGKMIDASMKNMAAQKIVHNLAETDLITVLDKPNLMDIQAGAKLQKGKLLVKVEGETYVIQVNDPNLFNAMTMIDQKVNRGFGMKMFIKSKHLLTAGVTSAPEFMYRNFIRDAVSTWAINEDGFIPIIDSIRGIKKSLKMEGGSIDMMFSGASFMGGNLRGNDPQAMSSAVRKALRRKGMSPEQVSEYENSLITTGKKAAEVIGHYWEKYERVGEAIENGSREAVYEAAIKAGKSHAQAAFEAKDLMDFSMHGASGFMQALVDMVPFLNARVQGLGKLGRAFKNNPKQIARRAGMVAAVSLGLLALNWGKQQYEDLPDWDKDNNWHFWFGDQHFRIPKPFEIGLMFGTLPERMVRAMGGKDTAGKFGQVVARNIMETFAFNPVPQLVRPLAEAFVNYDTFKGGPIDNMSDQNELPEARYDNNTSLLMRQLGELTGMSPKKLEHVVLGYTGTIGAYVMGLSDLLIHSVGDYGQYPSIRADQIPLIKASYQGDAPARNTQAMQDYYSLLNEANQVYATVKQYQKEGRTEDAATLIEENQKPLSARSTLNNAQRQFRVLRNEIALIERDRSLNSEQKRTRIDALLQRRNTLAAQLVTRFER